MGKFDGKSKGYDQRLDLYSFRVQKPESIANNADPDGLIVWKNKPIVQTPATTEATSSSSTSGTNSTNKI